MLGSAAIAVQAGKPAASWPRHRNPQNSSSMNRGKPSPSRLVAAARNVS